MIDVEQQIREEERGKREVEKKPLRSPSRSFPDSSFRTRE